MATCRSTPSHAAPAWACTGCLCVPRVVRPPQPRRRRPPRRARRPRHAPASPRRAPATCSTASPGTTRAPARPRASSPPTPRVRGDARDALLVGCGYLRGAPREARDAVDAASALTGEPVALVEGCCGLPLRLAGDKRGLCTSRRRRRTLARGARPGHRGRRGLRDDAEAPLRRGRRRARDAAVELLVEQAASALARMKHVPHDGRSGPLARPLSARTRSRRLRRAARGPRPRPRPRARRIRRPRATGALPSVPAPAGSRLRRCPRRADIAGARMAAHAQAGGGHVVPPARRACWRCGRRAPPGWTSSIAVDDLVSWIARALALR